MQVAGLRLRGRLTFEGVELDLREGDMREPPVAGSEADTLVGSLERQRRIIAKTRTEADRARCESAELFAADSAVQR